MNRQVVYDALKQGVVKIDFRSLRSGDNKTAICTLVPPQKHTYVFNQNLNNDKVVVWREDVGHYEDIQWDTIISWSKCETSIGKSKG